MSCRPGKLFRKGDRVIDNDHASWGPAVVERVRGSGVVNGVAFHVHFVRWPNGRRRQYPDSSDAIARRAAAIDPHCGPTTRTVTDLFFSSPATEPPTQGAIIDNIVRVLEEDVAIESWKDNGGASGSIREFGGILIVVIGPREQEQVRALLEQLRVALERGDDHGGAVPATGGAAGAGR
jgi:hypothetical protein